MPRVRLRVHHIEMRDGLRSLYTLPTRPGETFEVPVLRLATTAVFGPDPRNPRTDRRLECRAIIDTGAWLSVIEAATWRILERHGLIEFLDPPPEAPPAPRAVIGGARSPVRLGRVQVGLLDRDGPNPPRRLTAVPVTAHLLQDPDARLPYPVIFGLNEGVLDGRRLWRDVVMGWGEAAYDRTDAGPRFGQQWYLETA
jgi:hypothetical protein